MLRLFSKWRQGYVGLNQDLNVYVSTYVIPLLVYLAVGLYLSDR